MHPWTCNRVSNRHPSASPGRTETSGKPPISDWLDNGGFSHYSTLFAAERIDLDALRGLTADDLKELGIPPGDRKRMVDAIAKLNRDAGTDADPVVVDWVDRPQSAVVRRQLTIAFFDLVGSTDLSERLDPEDLIDAVSAYRAACKHALDRWQGRLAKFLGDGILALFGWPAANEDDAERAIFAALETVEAVSHLRASDGTPLSARVGIATGLVVIGDVGVGGLYERDCVVGAAPNLASRVQSFAAPGSVAIAPQTRRLIGERFELESIGEQSLKGFSEPVEIWMVLGVHRNKNRFEARGGGGAAPPLFGRDQEVDRLSRLWETASHGEGRAIVITGEAGIGKSRLLQDLREKTAFAAHLDYQCFHYQTNTALAPFIEKLQHEAGISRATPPEECLEKIESLTREWGLETSPAEVSALIAALLSVPHSHLTPGLNLSPHRMRERIVGLLMERIEKTAALQPLVLIFEDIHWADPSTIEFLETLIPRLAHHSILLVMTSRTALFDGAIEEMHLGRLDPDAVARMLHFLSDESRMPPQALASIAESAQGIPLFLEELAGSIGHTWDDRDESGGIPSTLQDLLTARLDHLGAGREIVNVAATIGMAFSLDLLGLLLPTPLGVMEGRIQTLCDEGILRSRTGPNGEAQFEFRHALVGETAYRAQLKADRRKLHKQIALTLERHFPRVAEHEPERLASHFVRARESIAGARYFQKAGQKALQSSAVTEAIRNLTEGLAAVETLPPSPECDWVKLRLQASLGTAHMQASGWAAPEVEAAYEAAASLSHAASTNSEAIWILWGAWVYLQVRGRIDESTRAAGRIRQVAERGGEETSLLIADMIALQAHFYSGQLKETETVSASFLGRYRSEDRQALTDAYSTDLQLVALIHQSIALWIAGETERSEKCVCEIEQLLAEINHQHSIAWGHTWGSVVHLLRGDTAKVEEKIRLGTRISHEQGFAYVTAMARIFEGWVDAQRGDLELGEQKMALGIQDFCSTGAEIAVPFFQTLRAEVLCDCGKYDEALRILNYAGNQVSLWGENWQAPEIYRIRGKVHATRNDRGADSAADAAFQMAMTTAKARSAVRWQIRAAHDYAAHLFARGDTVAGINTLDTVAGLLRRDDPAPENIRTRAWYESLKSPGCQS